MLAREGASSQVLPAHLQGGAARAFRERLEREDKHYKFSANDVRERRHWDAYQQAYEDAVNATSTPTGRRGTWCPRTPSGTATSSWGESCCATLKAMNPRWPRPDADLEAYALDELEESASSKR